MPGTPSIWRKRSERNERGGQETFASLFSLSGGGCIFLPHLDQDLTSTTSGTGKRKETRTEREEGVTTRPPGQAGTPDPREWTALPSPQRGEGCRHRLLHQLLVAEGLLREKRVLVGGGGGINVLPEEQHCPSRHREGSRSTWQARCSQFRAGSPSRKFGGQRHSGGRGQC